VYADLRVDFVHEVNALVTLEICKQSAQDEVIGSTHCTPASPDMQAIGCAPKLPSRTSLTSSGSTCPSNASVSA